MRYTRFTWFLTTFIVLLTGCQQKAERGSTDDLFEKYQQSVVLIRNEFYLQIDVDDGQTGYICNDPLAQSPMRTLDEQEAIRHPMISYGTGFFISRDGKIATNRHVAFPKLETDALTKIKNYFESGNGKSSLLLDMYKDSIAEISNYIEEHANELVPQTLQLLENRKGIFRQQKSQLDHAYAKISRNMTGNHVITKEVNISIAYNNTIVDSQNGYYKCHVIDKAEMEAVDLAILQLDNKRTPTNTDEIFGFSEHNPDAIRSRTGLGINASKQPLGVGDKLFMIGFNYGESMAQTGHGIKVQFTRGAVSQEPDDYKVLYSIPSLSGSSGSPVIDKWGNLVAINYAAIANAQSFNYGILAQHLKNMVMNQASKKSVKELPHQQMTTKSKPVIVNGKSNPEDKIRNFIRLEDQRNFEAIYQCFAPNISRYWDLEHPSRDEIRERYQHSWSLVQRSQNRIEKIVKIDATTYDLYSRYKFVTLKNETKELETIARFELDASGKITATYGRLAFL